MNQHKTIPRNCLICSAETRDDHAEFCRTCERRFELVFRQLKTDGSVVLVPDRVN
jgi:hypothetical protein